MNKAALMDAMRSGQVVHLRINCIWVLKQEVKSI
jgi:hypothetical protein